MTPQPLWQKVRKIRPAVYLRGREWALVEPEEIRRFTRAFEIDCVFDVGANEGQYAARLRKIGFKGLIFSFEPQPAMAARLRQRAAGDLKWQVFEQALDSEARTIEFNLTAASEFGSLHRPSEAGSDRFPYHVSVAKTVTVETTTLDAVFPILQGKHGFVRPYLKLDTQGHDLEVTRGGRQVIDRFVGLQSELAFVRLYEDAPGYAESLAYYESLGFKLSALVPNNAGHFPDLLEMDCIMYRPEFA